MRLPSRFVAASLCSAALLAPLGAAWADGPPAGSLEGVLAGFARMPGLEARFVEDKHLGLLAAPLRSEGVLYFDPPGALARHTAAPRRQVLLITPGAVTMNDGASLEVIDLQEKPVVRLFVESFVKILAGDRAALDRLYTLSWSTRPDGWEIVARPRVAPMSQVVKQVELRGQELILRSLRVLEHNGDETVTTFSGVRADRAFTPEERRRLFTTALADLGHR